MFRREYDEVEDNVNLLELPHWKISVTKRIERHVRITLEGMSLDGGVTFCRWQDIACIAFDEGRIPLLRHVLRLYVPDSIDGMRLAAELPGLRRGGIQSFAELAYSGCAALFAFSMGISCWLCT